MEIYQMTDDTLLRKMDRLGDKLSDMELQSSDDAPHNWQEMYDALEAHYHELESEYESRKRLNRKR